MFGDIATKCKVMDKYLGDMIHQDGLAASIEATVEERVGRITAAGHEIKAVMDDYNSQSTQTSGSTLGDLLKEAKDK